MNPHAIKKAILSAALKAEAIRIRHLRNLRRRALALGRAELAEDYAQGTSPSSWSWTEHHLYADRLRQAAVCPSQRARCSNLALGYLRGHRYQAIEHSTKTPKDVMYGTLGKEIAQRSGASLDEIVDWLKGQAVELAA
jgi:hypothetical protein